jgi:hypothetical protein
MHMLPALSFPVQLDEALGAEEVDTILAKNRCVIMFTFKTNKTIDDSLQVISQVRSSSIECMHI